MIKTSPLDLFYLSVGLLQAYVILAGMHPFFKQVFPIIMECTIDDTDENGQIMSY